MALPKADLEVIFDADASRLGPKTASQIKKFEREIRGFSTKLRHSKAFKVQRDNTQQGLRQVQKDVAAEISGIESVLKKSLQKVLDGIRRDAQDLTPKDTGDLRKSAFSVTEKERGRVRGKVGYNITSGPVPPGVVTGVDYAVLVHEDDTMAHPNGGQSGFLLAAVQGAEGKLKEALERDLSKATKNG